MFKELKSLFAFLTILPVGMDDDSLRKAAEYMPLFPAVGGFIGLLAGLLAWLLHHTLPALLVGALTIGFILLLTGLHHTDGLLDLGDGLMYQGPQAEKLQIMHDQRTGAGGLTLGLITILSTALCIGYLNVNSVVQGLIVAETSAKLAMVVGVWFGRSAREGLNTCFIEAMHGAGRRHRLLAALVLSLCIVIPSFRMIGLLAMIAGSASALIMVRISQRHFGGVTGDVIGAMNEVGRAASLVMILAILR